VSQTPSQPPSPPPASSEAEPVCPRHPDRVSYVRCQRCERPVCPECQRPAAVGVQCVDCVREAARATPTPRTMFGGTVTDGRPLVTYGLIIACVVMWLLQRADPTLTDRLEFAPYAASHRPWTFLTAAFLHSPSNVLHIASNMYALWICGQYLEPLLGRVRFAALYLISAIGGSVGFYLLAHPELPQPSEQAWWTPTVGASGAVFGLFASLIVFNRKMGLATAPIFVLIGINAVLGFAVPNIAWQAHLGGLVTGALAAVVLVFAPKERRVAVQWTGLAVLLAVLVVLSVLKAGTVPAEIQDQATLLLQQS
jgi:membrane associated rhomboid family serine protease